MPVVNHALRTLAQGNDLSRPYLNVRYINPHTGQSFKTAALIDTGADRCVLPASYAEILGHNLSAGLPINISGVSGQNETMYQHTMKINLDGHEYTTANVLVAFSPKLITPILGVQTFLSNFILTVNYPGKTFSLRLPTQEENLVAWSTP